MDTLLDLLETDAEFKSFHLDGQTIILEDYLQVRPERKPLLQKVVREGTGFEVSEAYRSNIVKERIDSLDRDVRACFVLESGPAEIMTAAVTPRPKRP